MKLDLLCAVCAIFLCQNTSAQHEDTTSNSNNALFKFKVAEIEAQWNPIEKDFIGSANYLLNIGQKKPILKNYFFCEYNFNKKEREFTFCIDPKIFGPLHGSFAFENDLFGIESEKYHFQTGAKLYLEDFKPFSRWFCIASIGMNYSMLGTAEHKLGKTEMSYNLLTNPIKITKNLFLVVQSFGRVRHGYDFHFLQLGIESRKLPHSVFMVGTGQIQRGKQEISLGLQIPFVENHKEFKL